MTFITPIQMLEIIAAQLKARRLFLNLSQQSLSDRSGVSLSVIRKYERTGKISLESLLKLAVILDSLKQFEDLFQKPIPTQFQAISILQKNTGRKRGRK